jgi:hypothetical protein
MGFMFGSQFRGACIVGRQTGEQLLRYNLS